MAVRNKDHFHLRHTGMPLNRSQQKGGILSRRDVALPPRYATYWREPFADALQPQLAEGARILDIGSGRTPSISPDRRPPRCEYVGLDVSASELDAAGPTAYDHTIAVDIAREVPELRGRFDLAVSWQVLEHVEHLDRAAESVRRYLRDGGIFVSMLSGSFAVYAIVNRTLPDRLGHVLVSRVMGRTAETTPVFPAHYDRCYATGLRRVFGAFSNVRVTPFYRAASYFAFSPRLMRAYLAYENFVCRHNVENLATHYLIVARR